MAASRRHPGFITLSWPALLVIAPFWLFWRASVILAATVREAWRGYHEGGR